MWVSGKNGDRGGESRDGRRDVEDAKNRLGSSKITTPPVPSALREHLNTYHQRRARARHRAGEVVEQGEFRGAGRFVLNALAWLSSLSDADIEHIDREGKGLLERVQALGPEYEGPLPYGQRSDSVLRGDAPGRGDRAGEGLGGVKLPKRGGKPKGVNDAVAADHAPVRVV